MKRKRKRGVFPLLLTLCLAITAFLWLELRPEPTYTVESLVDGERVSKSFETYEEALAYMEAGTNRAVLSPEGDVLEFNGTGIVVTPSNEITNLYVDEDLSKRHSYVAGGTRMILLGRTKDALSVQVSGANKYVPLENMRLYPEAVVSRRGYYEIRDGDVYHTVEANGNLAGTFLVGPTTKTSNERFVTEQVKDVFDSPYQFASIQSTSPYSAKQFDSFLTEIDSPLAGEGDAFKRAEAKYGINALFLLAVAGHESAYGTSAIAREKRNLFGFQATDDDPSGNAATFDSIAASVDAAAKLFDEKYTRGMYARGDFPGNKQEGINVNYASDPYWGEKVAGTMYTIDRALGLDYLESLK